MARVKHFLELDTWKRSREYALSIWELTLAEPFAKDFKLKDQIRSSSGSVMDNIAEGSERDGDNEFRQFLSVAKGSAAESVSQLYRAFDRKYIYESDFTRLTKEGLEISSMIGGLMKYLRNSEIKGIKFKK